MRKKFTRTLALACTAAMLTAPLAPVTAFAEETSVGSSGGGTIENDNSTLPKLQNVILPTIADGTYNFIIDVEGLLATHEPDKYVSGKSIYFYSETSPATLTTPTNDSDYTYQFVTKQKSEITDSASNGIGDEILALLPNAKISDLDTVELYAWQPDPDKVDTTGAGKFTRITQNNYTKFFSVDNADTITTITLDTTPTSGEVADIWSGKVYKVAPVSVSDPLTYYNAEKNTFSEELLVEKTTIATTTKEYFNPVVLASGATAPTGSIGVTYTKAVSSYTNVSNPATITNKSTFDIGVVATVDVVGKGLTFSIEDTGNEGNAVYANDAAEVYIAIQEKGYDGSTNTNNIFAADNSTTTPAKKTDSAQAIASYILPGTGTTAIQYQTAATEGSATGSHNYHKYLAPVLSNTYASASFEITAGANNALGTAAVKTAWEDYVKDINDTSKTDVVAPTINIVYKFVELESSAVNSTTDTKIDYTATNKAVFTYDTGATQTVVPALSTGKWATYDATNVQMHTISVSGSNGTVDKTSNVEAGTIVTVTPNVTTSGKMAGDVTVEYTKTDATTGTITATKQTNGTYTFTVPSDVKSTALTLTVTIEEVDLEPGFTMTQYSFIYGTPLELIINADSISSLKYINGDSTTTLISGTDYTVADQKISIPATTGKLATVSENRANKGTGSLTVPLIATINGVEYQTTLTINPKSN